jgi:hypothetical protein
MISSRSWRSFLPRGVRASDTASFSAFIFRIASVLYLYSACPAFGRAYHNLLARDGLLATRLRREAEEFGLSVISVDAGTVAFVSKLIEPHVEEWLQTVA